MSTHIAKYRNSKINWQLAIKISSPISVLVVWQLISSLDVVNAVFLPPPSVIFRAWWESLVDGPLAVDVAITLKRVTLGFLLGTTTGVVVAVCMAASSVAGRLVDPVITVLYPIPKVAVLPLLLIWLGGGDLTKVVVVATGAFFPVVINTYTATKGVDPVLVRAAGNLSASRRQVLRSVVVPAMLPGFYSGAILGSGLSWVLVVYAEMTAAQSGLGFFTYSSVSLFQPERAFAGVFTIAVLGWVWYAGLSAIRRWHCPWERDLH